jgi:integrase
MRRVPGLKRHPRDHSALCAGLSAGCLSSVCPRHPAVHPSPAEDHLVKRWRRPPLQHALAPPFARSVESLSTALSPATERNYNIAVRSFLVYLGTEHRKITGLEQLRRDPHILGWMARMRAQTPPLATATCIGRLIALRAVLNELAWTHKLAELAHLIRREDIPRTPQSLPRPLTAEQDQILQQELMRRNDLGGNVFLLLRHTGMRIGECVDLSYDCLHFISPNQWAIHVPLGKLKTERMVPVDTFVRDLVHRLRFFPSLDLLPGNGRLLAWHGSRVSLPRPPPRLLVSSLSLCRLADQYRPAPVAPYLRNGNAPCRRRLCCGHETARPHRSGHDHALCGCDLDRPPAGVPTGSLATSTLGSAAQNLIRSSAHGARRPHRFLARRPTRHGDVPPLTPKRQLPKSSSQALQAPHQDTRRNKKAANYLNENGNRLAG